MKRINWFFVFVLVMSLIITACGNTSAPITPTATSAPTEKSLQTYCFEEMAKWAQEKSATEYTNIGDRAFYSYEYSGVQWSAQLDCVGLDFVVSSEEPTLIWDGAYEIVCGKTTFYINGQEVTNHICDGSLASEYPEQVSVLLEKDGRPMLIDATFKLEYVDTVVGVEPVFKFSMTWGFLDTMEWAQYKCVSYSDAINVGGMSRSTFSDDLLERLEAEGYFSAVCAGEGTTVHMTYTQ